MFCLINSVFIPRISLCVKTKTKKYTEYGLNNYSKFNTVTIFKRSVPIKQIERRNTYVVYKYSKDVYLHRVNGPALIFDFINVITTATFFLNGHSVKFISANAQDRGLPLSHSSSYRII
jgi:hypothetical protein